MSTEHNTSFQAYIFGMTNMKNFISMENPYVRPVGLANAPSLPLWNNWQQGWEKLKPHFNGKFKSLKSTDCFLLGGKCKQWETVSLNGKFQWRCWKARLDGVTQQAELAVGGTSRLVGSCWVLRDYWPISHHLFYPKWSLSEKGHCLKSHSAKPLNNQANDLLHNDLKKHRCSEPTLAIPAPKACLERHRETEPLAGSAQNQ